MPGGWSAVLHLPGGIHAWPSSIQVVSPYNAPQPPPPEAVRLEPQSAVAYNTLGMVLSRFMEVKAARQAFEKAVELNPESAEASGGRRVCLAGRRTACRPHLA